MPAFWPEPVFRLPVAAHPDPATKTVQLALKSLLEPAGEPAIKAAPVALKNQNRLEAAAEAEQNKVQVAPNSLEEVAETKPNQVQFALADALRFKHQALFTKALFSEYNRVQFKSVFKTGWTGCDQFLIPGKEEDHICPD